jgi:hypothetical protein
MKGRYRRTRQFDTTAQSGQPGHEHKVAPVPLAVFFLMSTEMVEATADPFFIMPLHLAVHALGMVFFTHLSGGLLAELPLRQTG